MLTVLSAIWSRFGAWIAAAGAVLVAIFAALSVGKAKGKAAAAEDSANERANDREAIAVRQVNEAREASEQQVKAVQNAKEVASDNSTFDDDEVTKRLRDEWSRD
ncbi:putative Rz protein [Pseudomonas phage Kaya]|uniref:Rz protein n=1 Tax=Pseudomonas phage Kaya TaxID=2872675 RepID=A0AAE9BL60_9CAUD|nr:Rz-like spanin [Pseudomonas phage Kaya]UAG58593.1 putative Rz protein [Pseudomonas phage Kaya]